MTAYTKTQQLVDDITSMISDGRLLPGAKLPSARELREEYGCSQAVVRTAIDRLRGAGLVVSQPGVGVFVAGPRV